MPTPLILDAMIAKVESTYGTDPTPTLADDAIRIAERIWTSSMRPEYAFPNTREDVASGSLIQPKPGTPAGRIVNMELAVDLIGAGAAYSSSTPVRPPVDPLLISCGLARTHDDTPSSEKVTYAPASTGHGSCTIWGYAGNKLVKVVGCRGNVRWPVDAGQLGPMRFSMQGMVSSITEVALGAATYNASLPQPAVAMGIALGGWATPDSPSGEFNLGAEVVRLDDANGADGIHSFAISRFLPTCRLSARAGALATYDPYAMAAARTLETIDWQLGATQYNRAKLDVNEAYIIQPPDHSDDGGMAAWDIDFQVTQLALVFD